MLSTSPNPRVITRNRPSLSCLACRRRKVKCAKQHPTCVSCAKVGEICSYGTTDSENPALSVGSKRRYDGELTSSTRPEEQINASDRSTRSVSQTVEFVAPIGGLDHIPEEIDATVRTLGPLTPIYNSTPKNPKGSRRVDKGHLHVGKGLRTRYVENTFWASINGYETQCDDFISASDKVSKSGTTLWLHVDLLGLAGLLPSLPTRVVCDALLRSFMISVRPVLPIIHVPSFLKDYDNFFMIRDETALVGSEESLFEDPTLVSVIFAVLYCGAIVAPGAFWDEEDLAIVERKELTSRLGSTYHAALKYCRCSQYPTLNTLTALVLGESCSRPDDSQLADIGLVGMMVRIAQSFGLQRDGEQYGFDAIQCEMRRRLWWHIVSLDLQFTISAGATSFAGSSREHADISMVRDVADNDLSASSIDSADLILPMGPSPPSMLFSIARFQSIQAMQRIIEHAHSGIQLQQEDLDQSVANINLLHSRLDDLTIRIPARGFPEKGFLPSRITNASPQAQPRLYEDHSTEPTVFGYWSRIMVKLMKLDAAILLLKLSLGEAEPGSHHAAQLWTNITRTSCAYLQSFLLLTQTPSFNPYRWFYPDRFPPLQPVFIILTFLQCHQTLPSQAHSSIASSLAEMGRYLVDEVLDVFVPDRPSHEQTNGSTAAQPVAAMEWQILKSRRQWLDIDESLEESEPRPEPRDPAKFEGELDLTGLLVWSTTLVVTLGG